MSVDIDSPWCETSFSEFSTVSENDVKVIIEQSLVHMIQHLLTL
jgi:hypothetical protein